MPETDIAISINSLSKVYKLYTSRREKILDFIHPLGKKYHQPFYALKNISLQLRKGDILGIIGQNGSGKSTLLKILSNVVTPTTGNYNCNGKISSILELGGGFNPDLTGVENIYFFGGIRGIRKKEMKKHLDEILEFADIGEFAYQPVKNYSSGMYIRLAFSLAFNINPDILIIDEALAVGDIRFQNKCFRKLREFKETGKTIVFCSHSMNSIQEFCTRVIWLHRGEVHLDGDPGLVTDAYTSFMTSGQPQLLPGETTTKSASQFPGISPVNKESAAGILWDSVDQCQSFGDKGAEIHKVALYNLDSGKKVRILCGGEKICIHAAVTLYRPLADPKLVILITGRTGAPLIRIVNHLYKQSVRMETGKTAVLSFEFQFPHVGNGKYAISLGIQQAMKDKSVDLHWVHDAIIIEVANPDKRYQTGAPVVMHQVIIRKTDL